MNNGIRGGLVALAAAVIAGCAPPPAGPGGPRIASIKCLNNGPCEVDIVLNTSDCTQSEVAVSRIEFPRTRPDGQGNQNVTVRWKLPPNSGFGFCPEGAAPGADRVVLKVADPDNQFDPRGSDNPHGSGQCNRKQLTLNARNTVPNKEYPYYVTFHSSDGSKSCRTKDPVMFNE